ncbi:MAG: hypothetical protein LC772_09025 [Chloroflexi bacterium]|nr:hypothetical protein [Chloroflexota bacterium]
MTLGIAWLLAQAGAFYGVSWLSGPLGDRLEWIYVVFAAAGGLLLAGDLLGRTSSHRGNAAAGRGDTPEPTTSEAD